MFSSYLPMRKVYATAPLPLKSAALPALVTVTQGMGARQSRSVWRADRTVAVTLLKPAPLPLNEFARTVPCTSSEAAVFGPPMLTLPLNAIVPRKV